MQLGMLFDKANKISVKDACIQIFVQVVMDMIARNTMTALDMWTMIYLSNSVTDLTVLGRIHLEPIQFFLLSM